MSEITQPPPDVQTQDSNTRVSRLNAASDQNTSNNQSAEQHAGKKTTEIEQEKQVSHHDPAVTLASTLSKLDSGSSFEAAVSGHDADGRTIVSSELGTYLVEVDRSQLDKNQVEEFKKLQKEEPLDIRVLTVDKEIKAEIIKTVSGENETTRLVHIPVSLTLTELSHQPPTNIAPAAALPNTHGPIEDIKSQYQATTLYRAERIAREIGDKLDNLPLPTSSPNYTVYKHQNEQPDKSLLQSPQRVSSNVFIQEVSSSQTLLKGAQHPGTQEIALNQILGKNINVQVIKTVPQAPIPFPAGLPEAVIKELTSTTPLDHVERGQYLNINIAAIAVPESNTTQTLPKQDTVPLELSTQAIANNASTNVQEANLPKNDATNQTPQAARTERADIAPEAVISGIIIDARQTNVQTERVEQISQPVASATPYSQKNSARVFSNSTDNAQSTGKTYYLATPTSVLKFQSNTPLVAGTIVSFTVDPSMTLDTSENDTTTREATSTSQETAGTPTTTISQTLHDKIDQFFPQPLDQLTEDWASISLAMSALTTTASMGAAAAFSSRIPNMLSPEQITSTIFFFLSAIKSSTPARTWLGPDVTTKLKQLGAGRTLDRIDHDFTRISRLGAESRAGEWRPLLIPFQSGSDVTAVPMITKQIVDEKKGEKDKSGQNDDKTVSATRFMLEVSFSQFGKVLIDGLLKQTRLDIILKSADTMPYATKTKLSRQFSTALENANFSGELVIIDNAPADLSVSKMIETMTHKANFEKKI